MSMKAIGSSFMIRSVHGRVFSFMATVATTFRNKSGVLLALSEAMDSLNSNYEYTVEDPVTRTRLTPATKEQPKEMLPAFAQGTDRYASSQLHN